jgi:hypothetical protein
MPIAYNEKTGEALRLDENGAWSPTKIAKNPQTGETLALDGAQWVGVGKPPPAPEKGFLEQASEYAQGLRRVRDNALTLGFGDELAGVVGGIGPALSAAFDSEKSMADEFGKGYTAARDKARAEEKQFRQENPGTALAADLTVGLAIPAGFAAKTAQTVGVLPTIGKYAATGAGLGAVSGAGNAEGDIGDRAAGALGGGIAGGVVGAALPAISSGVAGSAKMAARPIMDRIGEGPAKALDRKIVQGFERDGKTIDQVAARLKTLGPEATIADAAGPNTVGLVENLANEPGVGQQMANRVLMGRQRGAGGRITDAAGRELGDAGFYETLADLDRARQTAARPLYEKAVRPENLVPDKDFAPFAEDKFFSQTIASVKADPLVGLSQLPDNSMPVIDATKRRIDDMIGVAKRAGEANRARLLQEKKDALVKAADEAFPDYAAAREAWAGPSAMKDAMEIGRGFAKPDSELTAKVVSDLTSSEKEAFLLGVRQAITDIVDRTGVTADATRKLFGTPKMQKALQAAFPDTASYRRFMSDLLREAAFNRTKNQVLGNSATARRLAQQEDAGFDPAPLAEVVQGNFLNGAKGLAKNALARFGKMPEAQRAEMARTLLTADPTANANALARMAAGTHPAPILDARQRQAIAAALVGQLGSMSGAGVSSP